MSKENNNFVKYKDFKKIEKEIISEIKNNFSKEQYELCKKVDKLTNNQTNKLRNLAKHYFEIDENQELDLDIRFAYYQIIEDCFKILKQSDEMLKKNTMFCEFGGDE